MVGKKLLGVLMSLSLALGSAGSYGQAIPGANTIQGANTQNSAAIESSAGVYDGSVDLAVANKEKLIEMLKKSGKISKDASPEEANKILQEYLKGFEKDYKKNPGELSAKQISGLKKYEQKAVNNGFLNSKDAKNYASSNAEDSGKVTRDKCLVILMEYPDLLHNNVSKDDTYMYYKDYTKQHYQDMIFGKDGYKGPNGENLISLKQYYDQQSGGSYDIEGNVVGWYKAAKNAAYYGGDVGSNKDANVRDLIKEALVCASKDVNLADYDVKDPYDLDNDGDINEPDGIIDHLMVIHSGTGQEAGGGALKDDAIWAHSSDIGTEPWNIPGTKMSAFPYTCMPEDGAAGVFCHEFGHDLGVPDEYDTNYTGNGEPIGYWTIMGSGSWAGKIAGTEPVGFSPYAKQYFQKRYGGKWQNVKTIDFKDVTSNGASFVLDQACLKGSNADAIKVTLPQKEKIIVTPPSGQNCYFSGSGNKLDNSMTTTLDLTNAKSAKLTFKTWYETEKNYDYASVKVKANGDAAFKTIPGNITTNEDPEQNHNNPGNGITGSTDGKWIDADFDLTAFAGKKIELQFNYWTDPAASFAGFYVDDINVTADDKVILSDNADGKSVFTLKGFSVDTGKRVGNHFYMLEWRNHTAADAGLAHVAIGNTMMSYDPGLLVYYVDETYEDNWVGLHPGEGYIGLVDADQTINLFQKDGKYYLGSNEFLMHDAAFSLRNSQKMNIQLSSGHVMIDNNTFMHPFFDDSRSYLNKPCLDAGRNIPKLGLKIYVTSEAKDRSSASIVIKK